MEGKPLELEEIRLPATTSAGAVTTESSSDENTAAIRMQARTRGRVSRTSSRSRHHERNRAGMTIQHVVRKYHASVTPADLRIARAYADSLMPRDQNGNLYTVCRRVEFAVYDNLGANIGLYMRFVWWGLQICGTCRLTTPNPTRAHLLTPASTPSPDLTLRLAQHQRQDQSQDSTDLTSNLLTNPWVGACTLIAIVPIVLNLSGDGEFLRPSNAIFTYHTLGNAPELHWLQGACDCATSLLLLGGLMYRQRQTRNFKKGKREEKRQRSGSGLSVTDYTLQIRGLPKTTDLDGKQLRALFETWGEVVAVSVSRAQRGLLMLLQERDFASVGRSAAEAQVLRQQKSMRAREGGGPAFVAALSAWERAVGQCGAGASGGALKKAFADAWLQRVEGTPPADIGKWLACKVQLGAARRNLNKIEAKVAQLKKQKTPCTGIAFVTFNEQSAANACKSELRTKSEQQLNGGDSTMRLHASFATHPDNIIWENLQITSREAFLRGFAAKLIC